VSLRVIQPLPSQSQMLPACLSDGASSSRVCVVCIAWPLSTPLRHAHYSPPLSLLTAVLKRYLSGAFSSTPLFIPSQSALTRVDLSHLWLGLEKVLSAPGSPQRAPMNLMIHEVWGRTGVRKRVMGSAAKKGEEMQVHSG